jgi:hypothetical protein
MVIIASIGLLSQGFTPQETTCIQHVKKGRLEWYNHGEIGNEGMKAIC